MDKLNAALQDLTVTVNAPHLTPQEIFKAVKLVVAQADQTAERERNEALGQMADLIGTPDLGRAAFIIMGCGALVEQGADPYIALDAVLGRLIEVLERAAAFGEACRATAEAEAADPASQYQLDDFFVDKYGAQVAAQMPENAQAWGVLEIVCVSAVAMLSRSVEGRKTARHNAALIQILQNFPVPHGMLDYLSEILEVLDEAELLVLYPVLERGYRLKISGIGDNFQLQTLLADAVIGNPEKGWIPGERPDPRVVAAARDQRIDATMPTAVGVFNLVNWRGLLPDGTLDKSDHADVNWIWGEGLPADIPQYEGTRIILLGPASYPRSWNAERRFDGMKGELHVIEKLKPEAVQDWLKRLANAPR